MRKLISVVTPCFNEEDNVEELCRRVRAVMEELPRQAAQLGPVQLLDRSEKGIHVDVNNFSEGRHGKNTLRSGWYRH